MEKKRVSVFRRAHFNAAHRLYVKHWSDEKNEKIFGPCSRPNYHGHNYEMEICVTGEVDKETGMVINLKDLKDIVKTQIEDRFDHRNLNIDTVEFKDMIPTAENICIVIWRILREYIDERHDLKIRLYETPRNFVEFPT